MDISAPGDGRGPGRDNANGEMVWQVVKKPLKRLKKFFAMAGHRAEATV